MSNAEERVVVGVEDVYYAIVTQDDENNYVAGTPAKLAPVMEIKSTPQTASETLYADNAPHDDISAEGASELELMFPNIAEPLLAELKGAVVDSATGRVFDNADPSRAPYFALGYRFKKSNGSYRYRWYLKCRVEPPGEEAQSQSNAVNMKPKSIKVSALKTIHKFDLVGDGSLMDGAKKVHGDEDTTNFNDSTWFNAVQQPIAGTPSAFTLTPVPADGASGISVSANLTLTFSNPLAGGREAGILLVDADSQAAVAVSRTINSARTIVTLDPTSSLSAATDYLLIVHDVVDIHGQTLANTVINFATA